MNNQLCEICGKRRAEKEVSIEGAILNVCNFCVRGRSRKKESVYKKKVGEVREESFIEEELIEDYGRVIKEARLKKGLDLEELAKKINERASYLKHVEKEEMIPSDKLIKKLEKELGIKLKEKVKEAIVIKNEKKKEELRLEDVVEIEGEGWE